MYLSKFDIKDGFYRLFLAANDCPRLSIILPLYPEEEQLVAIPLACTMGWTQSPPSFCTMSETVTDLTNARLRTKPALPVPSHRLSSLAASHDDVASWARVREPQTAGSRHLSNTAYKLPITHAGVFVDDFILLGQGGPARLTFSTPLTTSLIHLCRPSSATKPSPSRSSATATVAGQRAN